MGSQGEATQEPKAQSSVYQGSSLYNLTLDEVQNQLGNFGKPLGSMNLDELLKSVGTAEGTGQLAFGSSLNRQSSLTLSEDVRKKTVDEVWKDMQQKKNTREVTKSQERQTKLGEMTLEDFLVKAGVVSDSNMASEHNISEQAHWIQYQLSSLHQHQNNHDVMAGLMTGLGVQQQPLPAVSNPVSDSSYSENMVATMSPSSLMGKLPDTHSPGRKREASGDVVEKTMERRQKRMIKNRESAARSRARKQAYTNELEIKISHLEEENERLRRQHGYLLCYILD
ncbi:ABSCISIC ACID-INSENSITIVE 5-like protein 2 isoform X2 [Prosopis cineraria]|uniref:ABSCISIC ACID-INSENSITIVE 5-like protein 2 isoform X2 n=1 Tax=Prosopis cineraria TaxID=364024 RepID=UPI00240F2F90|nr:ABSCISIC ACID-INSENSITIVE 5-like protein 2 isoform X2 [Prosopis cineraria]XP_054790162.1 ABSCISIC ACID-INSENSITIVE 5-like protein 2 isoform X2 [Prosopis cineraria]